MKNKRYVLENWLDELYNVIDTQPIVPEGTKKEDIKKDVVFNGLLSDCYAFIKCMEEGRL